MVIMSSSSNENVCLLCGELLACHGQASSIIWLDDLQHQESSVKPLNCSDGNGQIPNSYDTSTAQLSKHKRDEVHVPVSISGPGEGFGCGLVLGRGTVALLRSVVGAAYRLSALLAGRFRNLIKWH